MQAFTESDWPLGWIPSHHEHGDLVARNPTGLLRMDNLTLEEKGTLRIAKAATKVCNDLIAEYIQSVYSTNHYVTGLGNVKLRYAYAGGKLVRNYGTLNTINDFDLDVFSGASVSKCRFLNTLGHILCIAGDKKYKDKGDVQFTLGIPKPAAPVISINAPSMLEVSNLTGGVFTNWSSVESSAYDDTSTYLSFNPNTTTNRGAVQTIFTPNDMDMTNLGGTGKDTLDDLFTFNIWVEDPSKLVWLKIEFMCETPTGSTTTPDVKNYYWHEWDMQNPPLLANGERSPYASFPLSANVWTPVVLHRNELYRVGNDDAKSWKTIKAIRISCGVTGNINIRFRDLDWWGGDTGNLNGEEGEFSYVGVEVRNTGEYLEFSVMSNEAPAGRVANSSIHVTRATPVDAQCNEFWLFRKGPTVNEYLLVNKQIGALGFTPVAFDDNVSEELITENAAINPLYTLAYYRTALPDNIIGMIWFNDRVIYLTTSGFIPSFKLDPGTYDSRFVYELAGSASETCLFITKLDVGTFLIGTTKDFYRITGDFSNITDGDIVTLNVNIHALGVSDPPISDAFIELEGSLVYLSSSGIRTLSNATSTLINGNLELLFRNETRYNIPAFDLIPNNQSMVSVVSSGKRIYWSLPCKDGYNRVVILMLENENTYWRLWTMSDLIDNPRCMVREDDNLIFFGGHNYVHTLETEFNNLAVRLKTQFNFGGTPNNRKDALNLLMNINTGGQDYTLEITGLLEDGSQLTSSTTINTNSDELINIDLKSLIRPSLAYAIEIYGTSAFFKLDYFTIIYELRPSLIRRVIMLGNNFGRPNKKKIAALPFLVDSLQHDIAAIARLDGIEQATQILPGVSGIRTLYWLNQNDNAAIDWELELICNGYMEFYKFMSPEILQIFPMGKLIDQFGPLDLTAKGLVFGMRLRILPEGDLLHYRIYDADSMVYEQDIIVIPNKDQAYTEKFPKGIDPAVLRIVLSSTQLFYRFSYEVLIRTTGKETEGKYIKVKDANSAN